MNPVMFRLQLDDPAEADAVARLVEERLGALDVIAAVQAEPEELPDLATAVTVVAAAVSFTEGGTGLVSKARRFIDELKRLVRDHPGLGRTVIVIGAEEVDLDEVSDEQVAEIVSAPA